MAQADGGDVRFRDIPERNTGDALLRTAQQHHVHLSAMADTKANIVITVSSVVLALFLAVLAVLPKYRPLRLAGPEAPLPRQFNLLFFGHFAELDRERFLGGIARALKPDGSVYATMAKDVCALGWHLSHHKYRYLRGACLSFLCGFAGACAVQLYRMLMAWV